MTISPEPSPEVLFEHMIATTDLEIYKWPLHHIMLTLQAS